ncbi:MAG: hypothetical protein A3G18_09795 [Rhodospirillales bacterium RIFCSPLOWO2_12_FULL_58_28]|nr:MAG: hypothetical protein A3H92_06765 [Rhodospirillales bacterium RIFCSPLOWO2_02_FULL_58_16]OHC78393.1 MAG: hypothetical protein A3G18_09795 [Rhodospirillales bacterium RIFCSPLOWO2_12_FULL_58_28]
MISYATPDFWACFNQLPKQIQAKAKAAYAVWDTDPRHPGLHFKPLPSAGEDVWSVRIGIHWRALGTKTGNEMIWFWIGPHAEYNHLISRRRPT